MVNNANERLGINGADEIKQHAFFNGIDWENIRSVKAPFIPVLQNEYDNKYFEKFEKIEPFYPPIKKKQKRKDVEYLGYTYKDDQDNDLGIYNEFQNALKMMNDKIINNKSNNTVSMDTNIGTNSQNNSNGNENKNKEKHKEKNNNDNNNTENNNDSKKNQIMINTEENFDDNNNCENKNDICSTEPENKISVIRVPRKKLIVKNKTVNNNNDTKKINRLLLEYKRQCDHDVTVIDEIDSLVNACENVQIALEQLFKKEIKFGIYQDEVLDFYFRLRNFTSLAYSQDSDHYRIYCDFDKDKNFRLHLFCIDPSARLQERLNMARASVYFSATLLPIDYYKDLLCNIRDVYAIYVDSVFEQKKRLLMLGTDVSSKYTRRDSAEYQKYARYIQTVADAKCGNYMVFGPSYKFLQDVYDEYVGLVNNVDIIMQKQNMTEAEREDFLGEFEKTRKKSLVAFCTLGGIFSEGIDLVGGRLIGVVVLGAGLPQIGNERRLMSDFFDGQGKNGFEYAYLYPGMNKVIQAAGRLIRTVEDVGVIALLDERFRFGSYRKTFPREWNDAQFTSLDDISLKLTKFWGENS